MTLLYVAIGGALGSMARYGFSSLIQRLAVTAYPLGILATNLLGCFCMGLLVGGLARALPPQAPELRAMLGVGFLGGFTTFSAFALDIVTLAEQGNIAQAAGYAAISVAGSVVALYMGLTLMRGFT